MNLQFNLLFTNIAATDLNMHGVENVYSDDEFIVERHRLPESSRYEFRLVVRRIDKQPIGDWRTLQDAKNQAVGVERQAIQVFPPESEVTDTMNHYHLWVYRIGQGPGVGIETPERHRARRAAAEAEQAALNEYLAMCGVADADRPPY